MVFEIREFEDPVLKTPASRVTKFDDSLKRLTEGMLETLRAREGRMALAANQVGVLKRMFVVETVDDQYVVVNPVIEEKTAETETALEGCLSIPGIDVEVERHLGVFVSGKDETGRPVRFEVTGEISRMMQHETDHRRYPYVGSHGSGVAQAGHASVAGAVACGSLISRR